MPAKILVVDDEPDLEILIKEKFRKKIKANELEFYFGRNGIEALARLKENPDISIVLTDLNMPQMDGLTLMSEMSKLNRVFKTIVISAYGDMSNIRSAMNRGASDFITKPIDFTDLEVTIDKAIQEHNVLKAGLGAQTRLLDIDKELDIAKTIQEAMLPNNASTLPSADHFQLLGKMIPAKQVGGDFYDYFPIKDNKIGLLIADVSGKSISASLFMAISRTMLRSVARQGLSAKEVINTANNLLCYDNESSMFVTVFYAILDPTSGQLTYCNAGHHPPYIITGEGHISQIGTTPGIVLGAFENNNLYEEKSVTLKKDDCLFLYTDGLTEAMNSQGALFGNQRLEASLKSAYNLPLEAMLNKVLSDIKAFTGEAHQSDDITMLCTRYTYATKQSFQIPVTAKPVPVAAPTG